MNTLNLSIDGQPTQVPDGSIILEAAGRFDIYIPALCHHPDLPPAKGGKSSPVVFQGGRDNDSAAFFEFEENKMFSRLESELIQRYLQQHGGMPGGGSDDLDDLF